MKCETDAFLYVMYEQADAKKFQIFPNSGQRDNRVRIDRACTEDTGKEIDGKVAGMLRSAQNVWNLDRNGVAV